MPFRTKNTYATSRGSYNTRKHTFTGKGPAPAGMRKTRPPKPSQVPTVTSSARGGVHATGFQSPAAARRAVAKTRAARGRLLGPPRRQTPAPRDITMQAVHALSDHPEIQKKLKRKLAAEVPSKAPSIPAERPSPPKVRPVAKRLREEFQHVTHQARRQQGPLPGLGPPESKVARKVLRTGTKEGATKKELLAAAETGLVESGFKNLPGGDADSEGWRQERTSIYGTGPTGPRNVKAGAKRFFAESVSDTGGTRGAGMTAGQLAQAIQGSAYPERYDERKPEAAAILHAFQKGRLDPRARRRLKGIKRQAAQLNVKLPTPEPAGPKRIPSVVYIGHQAEKKFGLHVGENPAFGGVSPVHVEGSYHYQRDAKGRGEAIDASGSPEKMLAFDEWVAKRWGKGVTELFYDPGVSIKEGTKIGGIGGHEDHVHVAVARPGSTFEGGYTAGPGGAVFVGYGSSAQAAAASAGAALRAAGQGRGRHVSPYRRLWLFRRERAARAAKGEPQESSAPAKTALSDLERKYGTS